MDETNPSAEARHTDTLKAERLARLSPAAQNTHVNKRYSRIIRRVAIILPVIALILLMTVFNWNSFKDDTITPIQEEAKAVVEQTISQNELLNPKFESVDDKGQPFTIIAARATQDKEDDDLVVLEDPDGALKLTNGDKISLRAHHGAFRQTQQKLFLRNKVVMTHQEKDALRGYQMTTEELHIDMATNTAWSATDVAAQGPAGTLEAKGMKASSPNETLIFTGPAKLILTLEDGLDLGGFAP